MTGSRRTSPRGQGAWASPSRSTVRAGYRRLERRFGPLEPPRRDDPLDELVLTVLSQNTSDVNSGRAYASLRERYGSWEEVAAAPVQEVADAIRAGGLANVKAPRIQSILRAIEERGDGLDLSWMRDAPDEEVRECLQSLPGVGPKTAAVVLAFSLGRPALPVDTHVFRVARRLEWIPPNATANSAHLALAELVPPDMRVGMHVGLIRLGREVCRPGRPLCEICPLRELCPTAPVVLAGEPLPEDRRKGRRSVPRSG